MSGKIRELSLNPLDPVSSKSLRFLAASSSRKVSLLAFEWGREAGVLRNLNILRAFDLLFPRSYHWQQAVVLMGETIQVTAHGKATEGLEPLVRLLSADLRPLLRGEDITVLGAPCVLVWRAWFLQKRASLCSEACVFPSAGHGGEAAVPPECNFIACVS